ncbi:hypothetical protein SBC2_12360 [Caballeronia sp. SBC2]|nr:hypothetical protein SBC2_12360 [Caballeronia sp. SBC2]
MLLRHGLLLNVIFNNALYGTIGFRANQSGKLSVDRPFGRPVDACPVIGQSSTKAGGLARSGLFKHRDGRIYMAYAFALRRHEAHRQYRINTFSPIG